MCVRDHVLHLDTIPFSSLAFGYTRITKIRPSVSWAFLGQHLRPLQQRVENSWFGAAKAKLLGHESYGLRTAGCCYKERLCTDRKSLASEQHGLLLQQKTVHKL